MEEGVFYSRMTYKKDSDKIVMDARTSDAVALAIRFNAPIYMTKDVLEKAGIIMDTKTTSTSKPVETETGKLEQLEKDLQEAINNEDYEKAALLKQELNKLDKSTDE